ncbi:MAG: ATP-binding protein [Xenococcaceae cyanobacterium MO_188.B29]|nr:ATP-binding protein [Xenococcaceae cyanobacterium MO_188.B29]
MSRTKKISVFNHSNDRQHRNVKSLQPETTIAKNQQEKTDDTIRADVVLIVDDTLTNLEVLSDYLQSGGFTVSIASDGISALNQAEYIEPNIILLDILMPGMNGFEVCQQLKANPKTRDIPVLFMTGLTDIADKIRGFELGGVDYVTKPVNKEEVVARIKTHLSLQRMRAHLQAQNRQLSQEIYIRQQTEAKLKQSQHLLSTLNEELEQRVAERTDELLQAKKQLEHINTKLLHSNQELEKFAYVVSHDLQTPLRSLSMFTQLLAQEYKELLDAQADEYISYISDGANRMQTLIQDLLAYYRAGNSEQTWICVNLEETLKQTVIDLKASILENKAEIIVKKLPKVIANPVEMGQLLQNLITNSIKFRGQDNPKIEIDTISQPKQWLISVKDNGIGIEKQYRHKVFQVFQRLHSQNKYPGTGVGLTICQKIVERYGGEIWVESLVGKSSTFYFTLPKKECLHQNQAHIQGCQVS